MLSGAVAGQCREQRLGWFKPRGDPWPGVSSLHCCIILSVCLDFFFLLWRESVSLSVVLIAVNLPLAEVLGLGLFCQHGSE